MDEVVVWLELLRDSRERTGDTQWAYRRMMAYCYRRLRGDDKLTAFTVAKTMDKGDLVCIESEVWIRLEEVSKAIEAGAKG